MWGMPTTRKETSRVVPNSDVVMRDRGWRCEGMRWDEVGRNG